jgi:hypothetical protein
MVFSNKTYLPILIFLLSLFCHCKSPQKSELTLEADSLISLTMDIQKIISSPEIHRISEFQSEIKYDLNELENDTLLGSENFPEQITAMLRQYKDLNQSLEQCLKACNNFNKETYILEGTIMEIRDKAEQKGADSLVLRELLNAEWSYYYDLASRIERGVENVNLQAEQFYILKPSIDSLLSGDMRQP